MWLIANEAVHISDDITIAKGERILMEVSRKFTLEDIRQLAFQSDFYVQVRRVCYAWQPHLLYQTLTLCFFFNLTAEIFVACPCLSMDSISK